MNQENQQKELETLRHVIEVDYENDPRSLIMILQYINGRYKYLPYETLYLVSGQLGIPLSQIYSIATFYKAFSLEPRGKHTVKVCMGTACHVRGGNRIKERLEDSLGINEGGTTSDKQFTLETVRCIGCCSLGPVVTIDDDTFSRTDAEEVLSAMEKYQ
jgi:NADH:ubiquinone oxidoreductase subunit E